MLAEIPRRDLPPYVQYDESDIEKQESKIGGYRAPLMQTRIMPLKMLLLETPAMTERPKTARAKYSAGSNSSVILAISGARNSSAKALRRPQIVEENSPICSALNACPFTVVG